MDQSTALHRQAAKVHTKIIRNFAVISPVKRCEISILANLKRANAVVLAKRVRRIDCRRGYRLGGSHAHLRATERKNHRHTHGWTRAGIKIGCEANDSPGFDQFARRCVMIEPQVKATSGKQSANDIRKR